MTPQQKAWWLFGGIAVLLAVASIVGQVLKARAKSKSGRAVIANLNARVNAWWVMVAVLAVAFTLGEVATLVLFGFASFFALREFITLTPTRRESNAILTAFGIACFPGSPPLISRPAIAFASPDFPAAPEAG